MFPFFRAPGGKRIDGARARSNLRQAAECVPAAVGGEGRGLQVRAGARASNAVGQFVALAAHALRLLDLYQDQLRRFTITKPVVLPIDG